MKKNSVDLFWGLAVLGFVIAAGTGWVFNIIEIAKVANDPITGMFILRIVGIIVAPLGAILGYV